MLTLKEYEIYLKVKKFIETEGSNKADLIPRLVNGIGIIPAYVPLIIESEDMEPTKHNSLSAAASTIRSISVRIGHFLSERSRTQLVHLISTLVLSERHQILSHRIFNEGYQRHNDSVGSF